MNFNQALSNQIAATLTRLEAQMLLLHLLGRPTHDRAWLLSHDDVVLSTTQALEYEALCERRKQGEPMAYITGHKAFFGLDLAIDPRVLDPRADTETLVDWCLEVITALPQPRLLDLGTGSGAIALALTHTRPDAIVSAVDASAQALAVAKSNAQRLGLEVNFHQGHWFATDAPLTQAFDVIVSNPPYIAEGDHHMAALHHEPRTALVSGADGLDDIRHIIAHAAPHLVPGGWLLLEHGFDQSLAVQALLRESGFITIQSRHDLAGHARCTGAQREGRADVK